MDKKTNDYFANFFIKVLTNETNFSLFEIFNDFNVFNLESLNTSKILIFELDKNNTISNLDDVLSKNDFKIWYKTEYTNKIFIIASKKTPKEYNNKIKPLISVCIPTGKRKNILLKALDSWNNSENIHTELIEIILVENGSSEIQKEELLKYKTPIKYINLKESNLSFARSVSVNEASSDILFLTNDDTIATSNLLEKHINYQSLYYKDNIVILGKFISHPEIMTTKFMKLLENKTNFFHQNSYKNNIFYNSKDSFLTNNLSILKNIVIKVGNFSSEFPTAASDDFDLGYRVAELGYKVLFKEDLISYHYHFYTAKDFVNSVINRTYWAMNYVKKYPSTKKSHFPDGIDTEQIYKNFYINTAFSSLVEKYDFENNHDDLNYIIQNILNIYASSIGLLKGLNKFLGYEISEDNQLKDNPLISVLLLVNENENLEKTINSLLNQSYQNWELALITDENNFNLKQVIEKYSDIEDKIFIVTETNKFKVLKNLKGKYIKFLSSNEVLMSYALEMFVRYFSLCENSKKIIYANYIIFDDDKNKCFHVETVKDNFLFNKDSNNFEFVSISSSFFEKNILLEESINFDNNLEYHDLLNQVKYQKEKIEFPFFIYYPKKNYENIISDIKNLILEKDYQTAISKLTNCFKSGFKTKELIELLSKCIALSGDIETAKKISNHTN